MPKSTSKSVILHQNQVSSIKCFIKYYKDHNKLPMPFKYEFSTNDTYSYEFCHMPSNK